MKKKGKKKDCGGRGTGKSNGASKKMAASETPELPENRADISRRYHGFSNSLIIYKEIQRKLMFNKCLETR